MEYLIRKCEPDDLSQLIGLCAKHAEYEQAAYDPEGKQSLLRDVLFSSAPKLYCFVVESDDKLQGYFSYTFDFSTWAAGTFLYLDCLYLEPAFRGLGIGQLIFEQLKAFAKKNNCVEMQWQTPVFNERAIKFYKRMGSAGKDKMRFTLPI